MHIHPISPTSDSSDSLEESAALKIQAGFRGYRVRKQLNPSNQKTTHNQKQRQRNIMDANNGNMNGSKPTNEYTEQSVEDRCATKIQAGVRGFLVRKKQKKAEEAATKIQAGFRGFKVRKEAQQRLKQN